MKVVHEITGGSGHQYITIYCADSADGGSFHLLSCTKGRTSIRDECKVVQQQFMERLNQDGWIVITFCHGLRRFFVSCITLILMKEAPPVLLFLDGHYSHISSSK